ncbi:MAG: PKD domain protein [Bacteroidetes bacterium ADurb.Bin408]|nr:MAG: PKD domain protein [Bacteroidetes bacterium ADurb.Bin408]
MGGNCATVADTMHITLVTPQLNAPADFNICGGASTQLVATGMLNYNWSPSTGLNDANIANPIASPVTDITYTIHATDINGCTASDDVIITVMPMPDINFVATPLSGCKPLLVSFTPASASQLASYYWDFGDAPSGFANNSVLELPVHQYNNSGTYTVALNVISIDGCPNTIVQNQLINVYQQPVSSFTFLPHEGDVDNMLFTFYDESVNAAQWVWTFGEENAGAENSSTLQNPQHLYTNTGFFDVWLYVTSPEGCSDSSSNHIIIRGEYAIYFPNAFTPDNDGINDYFYPEGIELNNNAYELYIYSRWGELVFSTDDVHKGWDGRMQGTGSPAQQDVYVWVMWQENYIIGRQKYTGHVTLIR